MKKTTKAALALAMTLMTVVLTACGGSADTPNDGADAETVSQNAAPASGATLTFGTNAEFPPFEYVTSSGVIDQYDGAGEWPD